jgi:hypothetical protein
MLRREIAKLATLLERDAGSLPPVEWLRVGWPRLVPVVLLAALPLALGGPLRTLTGWTLNVSLLVALAVSLVVIAPFVPALARRPARRGDALVGNAVVLIVGAFAVWLLYNRDFDGLANLRSDRGLAIDGAFHVSIYHHFVHDDPYAYVGFVSMYSVWYVLAALRGGDLPFALRATLALGLFVTAIAPCIVSFSLGGQRRERRSLASAALVCLVASLAVQYFLVLPLESFHLGAGFWAPLFGLIALSALWWIDVLVRPLLLRVAAFVFVTALYRYTYGLNLPELLATLASLAALDALGRRRPLLARGVLGLGALGCAGAALHAFSLLKPMFTKAGWIVENDLGRVMHGELWGILALALAALALPARADAAQTGIVRAVRFPLLFALWNVLVMWQIARLPPTTSYYQHKYSFQAVVLLAGAFVVVATFWAMVTAQHLHRRALVGLAMCLVLVAVSQHELRRGFAAYQPGFKEQAFGKPYRLLNAWLDEPAYARMRQTVAERHERFGGYVGSFWPRIVFMNALFGYGDGNFWIHPTLARSAGSCIFWDAGWGQGLDGAAGNQCASYRVRWNSGSQTLCWRCD